jgi:hypothetical protein
MAMESGTVNAEEHIWAYISMYINDMVDQPGTISDMNQKHRN